MPKKLETTDDIKLLVDTFYTNLLADERIGYMFAHLKGKHWQAHLEKMYRFWSDNAFNSTEYQGNPMLAHIKLHKRQAMSYEMFAIWFEYWQNTVNQLFYGETAEHLIFRASTIKDLMEQRVLTDELPMFMRKIRPN